MRSGVFYTVLADTLNPGQLVSQGSTVQNREVKSLELHQSVSRSVGQSVIEEKKLLV
jgi:hypothetical protein